VNLAGLIRDLRRWGVTMRLAAGGRVRFHPRGLVGADEIQVLQRAKDAAIELLELPYLDARGRLRIPLSASDRYRWWGTADASETHQRLDAARRCAEAWGTGPPPS